MFFIRHPQPLLSTRAVAMQVVARKAQAERDLHVIVVEKPAPPAETMLVGQRGEVESRMGCVDDVLVVALKNLPELENA